LGLESSSLQLFRTILWRRLGLGRRLGRLGLESPVWVVINKRIPRARRWNG
jgi:hypothetical protein